MQGDSGSTWRRRAAALLDVAIAVGLGVLGVVDGLHSGEFPDPGPTTAVLMGTAGGVLVLRRVVPLSTLTVSMGAMALVALLFGTYQSGTSVLIALVAVFSAASYGRNLPYVIAVCFGYVVALSVSAPIDGVLPTVLFTTALLAAVAAAGVGARRLRALLATSQAERASIDARADELRAEAAEAERARIARELHDILGHSLGVVVLQTGAADHALDYDADLARASVRSARTTAEQAIAQLETLVTAVRAEGRPSASPQPTLGDLAGLAADSSTPAFAVGCAVSGPAGSTPAQIQTSVYRIAQEGIANALKHSGGSRCDVAVDCRADSVSVEVVDDGISAAPGPGSRTGLAGVQERVEVFGGRMSAGPRSGGGWVLRAEIPVPG